MAEKKLGPIKKKHQVSFLAKNGVFLKPFHGFFGLEYFVTTLPIGDNFLNNFKR
jgi:hypothetical protein